MVHLITYDLNKPEKNYSDLYKAIKEIGSWWHYLDSTWLVQTSLQTKQVSDKLKQQMDDNDHLLVIRVMDDYSGWLKKDAWNWLNNANFS